MPPYHEGLIIGVCGRRHSERMVFVISQIHIDEIAAVANVVFYADSDLQEDLKEKCPYLFYEEFNNDFCELKAWAVTEHTGWVERYGNQKAEKDKIVLLCIHVAVARSKPILQDCKHLLLHR